VENTAVLSEIPSSVTQSPSEKLKQLDEKSPDHIREVKSPGHKQEEKSPDLISEEKPAKTPSVDKDLK
jgi:hypothetical protein